MSNKLLHEDNSVTNLLAAVVEQAISDYLTEMLFLYRININDPLIFKSIENRGMTVDEFAEICIKDIEDIKDFFMEGGCKELYGNKSGEEVLEALSERFTNEVIPTWEKTGRWSYNAQITK